MRVLVDTGQQKKKHELKHNCLKALGAELLVVPLPVGDYVLENEKVADVLRRKQERGVAVKKIDLQGTYRVSVDTKRNIQEIVGNICGKEHGRFRDECILAKNNNIKLYVLVENEDGVSCLSDLCGWEKSPCKDEEMVYGGKWTAREGFYKS